MAKRITKAMKIAAEEAKAATEGAAADTATEQTTTKVEKIEVVGSLDALISAFGSVDAALEACDSPGMQGCVSMFEANPDGKKQAVRWGGCKVIFVAGQHLLFGAKSFRDYCDFLNEKKAQFTAFGSLESALKAFKERFEKKAQFEADRAKRIAAYAAMCLTDGSTWTHLNDMIEGNLPEIVAAMTPCVGERPPFMQDQLKIAASTIGEFESDVTTALAVAGEIRNFEDYRAVLDTVKTEWKKAGKVCSYVGSLSLMIISRGAKGRFGMLVMKPDVKGFIAEFTRQFDAEQAEKRIRFESNPRNKGKTFEEWKAPRLGEVDPAFGLLNNKLFFKPAYEAYAAKKAVEEKAAEEKRAEERERKNQTLTFNLGQLLKAATEDVDNVIGAGKGRRGRREKGDRRHTR